MKLNHWSTFFRVGIILGVAYELITRGNHWWFSPLFLATLGLCAVFDIIDNRFGDRIRRQNIWLAVLTFVVAGISVWLR